MDYKNEMFRRVVFSVMALLIFGTSYISAQFREPQPSDWRFESDKVVTGELHGKRTFLHEGNAEVIFRGEYRITAKSLRFFPETKKVTGEGDVVFTMNKQSIQCRSIELYYEDGEVRVVLRF